MLVLISLFSAVIPILLYLIIIWKMDKYERESFMLVFAHFLWGAFGAVIFATFVSLVIMLPINLFVHSAAQQNIIGAVITAPFVEEFAKGLFLFIFFLTKEYDNITDGLVYGGAIGLGFGMTENLLYFITYGKSLEELIFLIVLRTGFTALVHCISTATFGAFLTLSKFSNKNKLGLIILGYLAAVSLHAIWNLSVTFNFGMLLSTVFMLFIISLFFVVFRISIKREKRIIITELSDEADEENLSEELINIIVNDTEQLRKDKTYGRKILNNAVKLAFRKHQAKISSETDKSKYLSDINLYRKKLTDLISNNS